MIPRLLTKAEFDACFSEPMRDVTGEADSGIDIWPYVDAVTDFPGQTPGDVDSVYRDAQGRFDLVNITTDMADTFLVVVVDLRHGAVHGHHLLDLPALYGLPDSDLRR